MDHISVYRTPLSTVVIFNQSINQSIHSEAFVRRHLTRFSSAVQQYCDKIHKTVSENNDNVLHWLKSEY